MASFSPTKATSHDVTVSITQDSTSDLQAHAPSHNNQASNHRKTFRRRISLASLFHFLSSHFCMPPQLRRLILFVRRPKALSRLRIPVFANTVLGVLLSLLLTLSVSYLSVETRIAAYPTAHLFDPSVRHNRPPISDHSAQTLQSSLADDSQGSHVLHQLERSFSVPPSLSERIPTVERYILLNKLQASRNTRTKRAVRLFVLHVVGDKAERRLDAIATAITYSRNTERVLLILWDVGRGGEAFGADALRHSQAFSDIDTNAELNAILCNVHALQLAPNLTHWSEYQINYYTTSGAGGYPLDSVAALTTRHIFYRANQSISGRYANMLPGVQHMSRMLTPGPKMRNAWFNVVKPWVFPHLDPSKISDILNRVYGVPWIFLDAMTDDRRRVLLRSLDRSTSKRAFFVHAQYGLGNRLRALGSVMAVAKVTGRVLVLIWEPDVHLDCLFHDLFVNELIVIDKLNMKWPLGASAMKDHALQTVDFFNFMRQDGGHVHNPLKELVNPRNGRHVYVKTAYVVRSTFTPRIISTTSKYWQVMRDVLTPQLEIMELVQDPMFANIGGMVGVHIRSRTIENDIKGVSKEFYGDGARTTNHWRNKTGLKTFEAKIVRLSLKYKYFVAADSREAIEHLERKFGSHRIFSLPREQDCVTRDVECAKLALADILLLSRVPTLLGSHWSSFTEGAVRLSGRVKVLLAGVHFGRSGRVSN